MAKASRDKGKRGELEIAKFLRERGFGAYRGQQFSGRGESPDVVHSIPDLHIEVKRTEKLSLWAALAQAEADAGEHQWPTVWHRKNGKPWVVILTAEDFLFIYSEVLKK